MNIFVLTQSRENNQDAIIVKNGLILPPSEKKDREVIVKNMLDIQKRGKAVFKSDKVFVYSYETKYLIEFQTKKRDMFNRTLPVMVYIEGIDDIKLLLSTEFKENIKQSLIIADIDELDYVNKGVDFIINFLKKKQKQKEKQKKIKQVAISVSVLIFFIWIFWPRPILQFDISITYENQLDSSNGKVSSDLKEIFKSKRNKLSNDAQIEKMNTEWRITDPISKDIYVIKKDEKKSILHVEKTTRKE
jgi:hypothetical protein